MFKVSTFLSDTEFGRTAVPLFGPADTYFEKTASAALLPEVVQYIESLRPRNDAQYVLVNALGAGEYFSSNVNGDFFDESGLIHKPNDWTGNPLIDKARAKDWPYGFPTFYYAHPYAHHRNKDSSRAYGEVEFATWNNKMKRVELVTRIDHDKCVKFGGMGIWDRLKNGDYPDVSMGSRVPYDLCSVTLDKKLYQEALAKFDPKKHRHPGMAALEFHKKLKDRNGVGIRGLAVTRADYSDYCRDRMNQILPDGRKVFVYNDFPRFFDISYVFIGADRTAKVMVFISRSAAFMPSAFEAEKLGMVEDNVKTASISDRILEHAFKLGEFKKDALDKESPSNLPPGKAVPLLTKREPSLSSPAMDALRSVPLRSALSTTAGLGIVLRPSEFQNLILSKMGKRGLADELDKKNITFPETEASEVVPFGAHDFVLSLARKLMPEMDMRSGLGPIIQHRVVMIAARPSLDREKASSLPDNLLRKMAAAYNGYRKGLMSVVASAQDLIQRTADSDEFRKLASTSVEEIFTPLSFHYLDSAFRDEVSSESTGASVQRATPSRNTWM